MKLFPLKLVSTVGFLPTHTCHSASVPKNCAAPYTIRNLPVAHRQYGGVFITDEPITSGCVIARNKRHRISAPYGVLATFSNCLLYSLKNKFLNCSIF